MRVFPIVPALALLLLGGCGQSSDPATAQVDHQSEWRNVLRHKPVQASAATLAQKQAYADSVRAFVQKHPNHGRAREVWVRMQLEFADELSSIGRYQDAIRFYRSVLAHDETSLAARKGLADAAERLAVSREKLLLLEKGMSKREVASILGKPIPGWSDKRERSGATIEAWYYRTGTGSIAGVYFREGRVFAAEESSNARLGRLGS